MDPIQIRGGGGVPRKEKCPHGNDLKRTGNKKQKFKQIKASREATGKKTYVGGQLEAENKKRGHVGRRFHKEMGRGWVGLQGKKKVKALPPSEKRGGEGESMSSPE